MKTNALFLLCLLGLISTSMAGTWTVQPWTGDASTGIVNGETQWAYHFGAATAATVNGVSVPGFAGPPPVNVAGQFDLTGAQFVLNPDPNNLTSLGGTSSAVLAGSFFYGGVPTTNLTVKAASLQPGARYVLSLLSVGWDGPPDQRLIKFVSGADELAIDQNLYGNDFGLRADYAFTAGAGDLALRVDMNNEFNRTFHIYAVALRKPMFDTSVSLTSSVNPVAPGAPVTFTTFVTGPPGEGVPTGTVNFKEGGVTLGSGTLDGSGMATFTTSALTAGNHSIVASYPETGNFRAADSSAVVQAVGSTLIVTNAATAGVGTLAQAITDAPSGSVITFLGLAGQAVPMPTSEIIVDKDLTIDGSGLMGGSLQGSSTNRLFYIPAGRTVVFKNLTLRGGGGVGAANTGRGGAVLSAGSFTAEDCQFSGNSASLGGALASGYSTANTSLILRRCVISGNTATGGTGGAVINTCLNGVTSTALLEGCTVSGNSGLSSVGGGACYNVGNNGVADMTLRQCTLTGNTTAGPGAAVLNWAITTAGLGTARLTLDHCTVVGNTTTSSGGAVVQRMDSGTATTSITSCIIAGNQATSIPDVWNEAGTMTSLGTNLIGDTTGSGVTWTGTDLTGTAATPLAAGLMALDSYGSAVPTMPPGPGSPALDQGTNPAFPTDQRGMPRVLDGDLDGTPRADIGAVESDLRLVDVATDELDTPSGNGDVSLREALRDAAPGAIIRFAPAVNGQTITLDAALGQLTLDKSVFLDTSALSGGLTLRRAAATHRGMEVQSGVFASLSRMTFTSDSSTFTGDGAGILNNGTLNLSACTFSGNKATGAGGAIHTTGTLNLQQCTLANNQATFQGGGISQAAGRVSLTHCTLTGNAASTTGGGGIYQVGGLLSLHNSLVAGNTGTNPDMFSTLGTLQRSGANVIGSNVGVSLAYPSGLPNASGDYVGDITTPLPPQLGALASNGGPTQTCLPLPASPATDHATETIPAVDQRGISRPRDGNADNTFAADIGAAESGPEVLFQVNTLADELDTPSGTSFSLREVLREAPPGTVITFAPALSGKTLTWDPAKGDIIISKSLIIDASALPQGLILDAGTGTNRHFYVSASGAIELRHLTLTGGGGTGALNSGFGGSILSFGPMNLTDCTFRDNQSTSRGGAITMVNEKVQITRCTFHDNFSSNDRGGALYLQLAPAVLDHCTLTRNYAGGGDGGAIFTQVGTDLTLTHCTIAGNTSNNANGGIAIVGEAGDKLTLNSTILAGNLGQDLRLFNVSPTPQSGGGNVMGLDGFFSNYAAPGDVRNVTATQLGLAELGRYGGLTDTMPPLPGSPALDAASLSSAGTDQRGFARFQDGNFDSNLTSDSGAVESFVVRFTTGNDENHTPAGALISLREAVRDAPDGAVITSTASTWFLTSQELVISRPVILASTSPSTFQSVVGASVARMLHIAPGARVHLNRLSFSGGGGVGATLSGKGGAILNQGSLSLTKCNLTGAKADFGGAIANGMAATPVWLKMSRCSISTSTATAQGGAIYNAVSSGSSAVVELDNTQIHTNTATRQGGALANVGGNGTSTFTAEHCTIMKNTSQSSGGGVFTSTASAITRLTSCLIAENTAAGGGPDVQTTGSLYSGGTNLIGIGDGGTIWEGSDLTGTAAAPLDARTGSEVGSLIPRSGSPAIDAAAVTYRYLFDRADNPRMVDGDLSGTAQPDIGAYEVPAIRITTAADEFDTPSGASVSLREAIRDASTTANNLLLLDPALSGQTLTLDAALGQIEVGKIISLDARGLAAGFTIDGGTGTNRLFQNLSSMHLRGLRLTGGAVSGDGGAILSTGTLVLEDCTLSGHTATGIGGAVACTSGSLLVKRCAFAGNTATSHGGALACTTTNAGITLENSSFTDNESSAFGGAVYISSSTSINNRMVQCTLAGNRSAQSGGGGMVTNSHLSLLHSTLTQNRAATQRGGGLVMDPGSFRQTLQNTVIADNYAPTLPDVAVDNQNTTWPLSAGGNLIGQNTGATTQFPTGLPNAAGDYVGSETAPLKGLLAPYGIYGGTTPTCPPMLGSPALDKAVPVTTLNLVSTVPVPGSLTTDQRGFTRSVDGDFNGTALTDIGAAESVIVRVDVANDEFDEPAGANDVSLREAVRDAPEGAVIGFVPALSGQTLTLNEVLEPERAVIISGSGLTNTVDLTSVAGHRIFHLSSGLTAGLSHLGLNGAAITIGPGGAIYNEGSLSLADCSLSGNSSTSSGGAISSRISFSDPRDVSLRLSRCVISLNQAGGDGGAIDCYASSAGRVNQATLEDCIFNDNSATGSGGAMSSTSGNGLCATTLRRCTFTRNDSPSFGGAFTNFSPNFPGRAEALLESCTLNGNSANTGGGVSTNTGFGGTATATLKQCTITQNEATFQGGGVHNQSSDAGSSSALFLTQCTISGNSPGGGVVGLASNPGNTNTTTLDRCLIAGNGTQDFATFPYPGAPTSSTLTSLGTNLIGNADGSGGPWQTTDLLGTTASPLNPMLAELGSYGGPTQTMPPLPGSPARDRIIDASATGQVDQRGGARLVGTKVDIGAVEAGAADAPGTIAFGTPLIRVQENVGILQVPVFRTGGNIGTVEVMLATSTGSGAGFATATSDFTPIFGDVLNFGPGETVEYMPITIVSDPKLKEPHEDFTLTLSNVLGGATLGAQSSATVRILDFVDTAVPSLTLTTPLANAKVTDPSVTVSGTAKDDKGVQSVQVQQNGGAWVEATLTGTPILKTFSLPITATPGVNALVVRTLDEKGKVSALTKRSFTYKVTSTLTVNISPAGAGTVTAGFAPSSTRDVGITYKITATPKSGFIFTGWSANQPDIGIPLTTFPAAVSFVMKPGLNLYANFIPLSGISTYAGTYQAVLEPNNGLVTPGNANVGFTTLSVTNTTGVVSGKVLIDGVSQPFTGQIVGGSVLFTPNRSYELGIVRKGKPLIVFAAQVSGGTNSNTNFVYGGYQNGSFQQDGSSIAYLSPYSSKNKVPTTLVTGTSQRYNLIFPSVPDQPGVSAYPPGTGIGSLILGSDGIAKMAGTLADNTTFTASTTLSSQHTVPLFAPLYTNQGHIAGNINVVAPTTPGYDAYGVNFYWCRPAQIKAQWYPLGWPKTLFIDLVGAKYLVPPVVENRSVIPGLGPIDPTNTLGNATLTCMYGLLTGPQSFPVNITTKNVVTPLPLKTKNFTLKLTPTTGEISGTFLHTDTKKPAFKAATIQKPGDYQGTYGYFMSVPPNKTSTAGEGGAVMLLPNP